MRGRAENFLAVAKRGTNIRNNRIISLSEDPVTSEITLPDGRPLNGKIVDSLPGEGDLRNLEKIAEDYAATLKVPPYYRVGVFYRQIDVSNKYNLEFYFVRRGS